MTNHDEQLDRSDGDESVPTWPCPSCRRPVTYPTGGNRAWCDDCGSPTVVNGEESVEGEEEEPEST